LESSALVAEQLVAFALDQVSKLVPPNAIDWTSAIIDAVGAGPTEMLTESDAEAPPAPTHVRMYVVDSVGLWLIVPVDAPPVEKMSPLHSLAFVLDQLRSIDPPDAIEVRDAESVAVTAGPTTTSTVCCTTTLPRPLHVSVYVVTPTETGVTSAVPTTPPPVENRSPVHVVALLLDQLS
jgi:hypothetical protein